MDKSSTKTALETYITCLAGVCGVFDLECSNHEVWTHLPGLHKGNRDIPKLPLLICSVYPITFTLVLE